jgi:hypothetical protein
MKQEFVFTALPSNSVTRLGELSPNEWLSTLCFFRKLQK